MPDGREGRAKAGVGREGERRGWEGRGGRGQGGQGEEVEKVHEIDGEHHVYLRFGCSLGGLLGHQKQQLEIADFSRDLHYFLLKI